MFPKMLKDLKTVTKDGIQKWEEDFGFSKTYWTDGTLQK
jgi:hypothetical protein